MQHPHPLCCRLWLWWSGVWPYGPVGNLLPKCPRPSPGMDFSTDPPWLCPPLGWAPWCNPGIQAFSRSPWGGMLTKCVKAPASCSCGWAPVLPATACPSTGGPWGRRLYCSWSSADAGPGLSSPRHTCLPYLWTNLRSAGDPSWASWSGITCMGRCPRSSLPGNHSSLGPLAWIVSETAVLYDPLWPPGLSCPPWWFRWVTHQPLSTDSSGPGPDTRHHWLGIWNSRGLLPSGSDLGLVHTR